MKIIAAVVTHNRRELLGRCIDHLQRQTRAADKIIIINNGTAAENFQVTFLVIYNYVETFIAAIFFPDQCFKHIFHNLH